MNVASIPISSLQANEGICVNICDCSYSFSVLFSLFCVLVVHDLVLKVFACYYWFDCICCFIVSYLL